MKIPALAALLATSCLLLGCGDAGGGAGSASASAAPAPTPKPTPTVMQSAAPTADPILPPRSDCPKDSKGGGSLKQPCEAAGDARIIEVKYLDKMDDKGPFFNVKNLTDLTVNYGQVQIYFYDKAGKLIDTKDGKKKKTCSSNNLFLGTLKKGDLFKIQFGCLKKDGVPDGTASIEAEVDTVGVADKADEKKVDLYWHNKDLAPDDRAKGGIKPAKK